MVESSYKALRTEQGVFSTPPYSSDLKPLWRFKDLATAQVSAGALWQRFKSYRNKGDFIGMDVTRKFIQMGRTRSLRYALRQGGKKYAANGQEVARTGRVYDQEKLAGAKVFERYLDRCWSDQIYSEAWEKWRNNNIQNQSPKRQKSPENSRSLDRGHLADDARQPQKKMKS